MSFTVGGRAVLSRWLQCTVLPCFGNHHFFRSQWGRQLDAWGWHALTHCGLDRMALSVNFPTPHSHVSCMIRHMCCHQDSPWMDRATSLMSAISCQGSWIRQCPFQGIIGPSPPPPPPEDIACHGQVSQRKYLAEATCREKKPGPRMPPFRFILRSEFQQTVETQLFSRPMMCTINLKVLSADRSPSTRALTQ